MTYQETLLPQAPLFSHQGLGTVARAEQRRLLRKGGVPVPVIVAIGVGLLIGVSTMLIMRAISPEPNRVMITTSIEVAAFVSALILSIATVFAVGRDHTGQLGIALTFTPNRRRLFTARALSWAMVTASTTALLTCVLLAIGLIFSGGAFAGSGILSVVATVVGSTSVVLIAMALAHLVGRAFGAVLLLIGINVILPLLVFGVGAMIPQQASSLVDIMLDLTPTPLFIKAISATTVPELGAVPLLIGQLGLAIWAVSLGALAAKVFQRRNF